MSHYRRSRAPGATFFFTVVAFRRQPILCDAPLRVALRNAIRRVRSERPFTIDAWVLLPDHLHCIWTLPLNDADFGSRWNLIKRHTVRACGDPYHRPEWMNSTRLQRRESTLWQRRFWEHQIRDDADYLRHMDYLHMNPVKHGHCARPDAWPYSSLHRLIGEGLYPAGWATAIDDDPGIGEP